MNGALFKLECREKSAKELILKIRKLQLITQLGLFAQPVEPADHQRSPHQVKVRLFALQIGKYLRFRRRMSRCLLILSLPRSTNTLKINAAF